MGDRRNPAMLTYFTYLTILYLLYLTLLYLLTRSKTMFSEILDSLKRREPSSRATELATDRRSASLRDPTDAAAETALFDKLPK